MPHINTAAAIASGLPGASTSKMTLPVFAKKVKKLASLQILNFKLLLNGRGFSKFKKTYKLKGEIGQGGFGIVYSAIRICDDTPVAVKFIERRHVRDWGKLNEDRVPLEIVMLSKCNTIDGVIKLLDWFSMPEGYLIVMERPSPCIDMFDFIRRQSKLPENLARFLFRQVVQTTLNLMENKILHRDLKDENVVIDLITGETRLIDFGAATLLKKTRYYDFQGTRLYCPPEWFLYSLYLGREAAVWSLGVLLYNMLNGRLPFQNEKHICTSHLLGPLPFYAEVSGPAHDLIRKCLTFDPANRLHLEELLRHPWFSMDCSDWNDLTVDVDLVPSSERGSESPKLEKAHDDKGRENSDKENLEILHHRRRESGVASASRSRSFEDKSHLEKPDQLTTTIAKGNRPVAVRRNAKTSMLHPICAYQKMSTAVKPQDPTPTKSKSGSVRPMLQSHTKQTECSFDSGTSSFAYTSHDSLQSPQSPLASPEIQTNNVTIFSNSTESEVHV